MATKKWEAADLRMGRIEITETETDTGELAIRISRTYQFVDAGGNLLSKISGSGVTREIAWADIPTDIQAALTAISDYTYNQALQKEGMNA